MVRTLSSRYVWSLAGLCLAAVGQFWFVAVLLVTRQVEALLLAGIIACVFWFWCLWASFLGRRKAGMLLAGCCLAATLALSALCLFDLLDISDTHLLSSRLGAPRVTAPLLAGKPKETAALTTPSS